MSTRLPIVAALLGLPLWTISAQSGRPGDDLLGNDPSRLTLVNVTATRVQYRGRDAIKVVARPANAAPGTPNSAQNTIAIIRDSEFSDGTIEADIAGVVEAAGDGVITKVILETSLLTDPEKIKGCELSKRAGADFVKTSTGFGPGGATAADIALMRRTVGIEMGVKASGGIRDRETALLMVQSGASRIGASASVAICDPAPKIKAGGAKAAEAVAGKY